MTTPARYDQLIRLGWRLGSAPAVPMDEPIDWEEPEAERRSWFYHLQALDPIEPALAQWSAIGDLEALELAVSVALDWAGAHADRTDPAQWPRVWYDMATGLRAYRLSYLLEEARRANLIDGEDEDRLLRLLQRHLELLVDEARFTAHSNHGFFQSAGLLALCRRVLRAQDQDAGVALATARLRTILDTHFAPDGVHKEHSPDYHLAVLEGFKALIRAELLKDDAMFEGIARAERALSWFVKPDGRLVNFGDSDNRLLPPAILEDLRPLKSGMRAFADGGYAVVRAGGDRGPTYLAQTLCFHSRTHKQADDLSLVWTDRGRDILIDAGRYAYGAKSEPGSELWKKGYWYTDPIRVFMESAAAHNTIEIDGESHDRRRQKHGSALRAAGDLGGVRYVLGAVQHGPVTHSRLLLLAPGQWLCIVDGLRSTAATTHRYRQWLHLAPQWSVTAADDGFLAEVEGAGDQLRILPLTSGRRDGPILGRGDPKRQGWWSPAANKLEPAPAIAISKRARSTAFVTLLAFDDQGASGAARVNPDLHGQITLDIGRKRIRITRDRDDIEIAFRSRSA
ncbi:heparinase II/III family protein [Brevundimonas sp.]|uniref:heparinase II/III domain-containing protein n=1 Tax=Brevundimonas sp. TaxID=1871086 RepID=UPI0035AFF9FB